MGFTHRLEQARLLRGWALAMQGDAARGVAYLRQGLAATQGEGLKLFHPYLLALLAEAYEQAGKPETGLTVLDEALTLVAVTDEWWWEVELYRLKGELSLAQDGLQESTRHRAGGQGRQWQAAEACLQSALDIACSQQARTLELRTALSLHRLWQRHGKRQQVRQILAEVYGWFSEGFTTPDLQEARAQLEACTD